MTSLLWESSKFALRSLRWSVHSPTTQNRHGTSPCSFEVDLLSFSLGGGEHPSAEASTLFVKHVENLPGWQMKMEIHENLLAVLLKHREMFPGKEQELWVFDWKTGEKITVGAINVAEE
jgi:hypothetical protein